MAKDEFCIMPYCEIAYGDGDGTVVSNVRSGRHTHRHEVFYGTANRKNSIKYGLVVFLTPEDHNMSNHGVHFNKEFDIALKQKAQRVAMDYYDWSIEDFRAIFGKNYL